MPRRIVYSLAFAAFAAFAAGLMRAGWPGAPGNPATLVNRVDVIATVVLLAGLPWVVRRRYGPAAHGRLARVARASGYAAIFALVAVKTGVARTEYATVARRHLLAGVWTGEVVFLGLLAACVAGLLAVTARRSPAGPPTVAIGLGTGVAAGLVLAALPPMGHPLHLANAVLAWGYDAARVLAMVTVMGATVAAGMAAARRTSARAGRLSLSDARGRQGVAAGLCAGTAAALLASLVGLCTIALLPQEANRLAWSRPYRYTLPKGGPHWTHPYRTALPDGVYQFEVGASDSAAGFLSVLVLYPLFGAGLGAWGGLFAADQRRRPGGGGGGGGQGPDPVPPPPDDGDRRDPERVPAILRGGYLRELPLTGDLSPDLPDLEEEPVAPAVTSAYAQSTPRGTLSCADGREPGPEGG
jgi:hypothetical protein